mgnify:FL=1
MGGLGARGMNDKPTVPAPEPRWRVVIANGWIVTGAPVAITQEAAASAWASWCRIIAPAEVTVSCDDGRYTNGTVTPRTAYDFTPETGA